VPKAKQAGDICRDPIAGGNTCDGGETCDGTSLECPTTNIGAGCELGVALVSRRVALADCRAQNVADVSRKETACEGEGSLDAAALVSGDALGGEMVIDPISKPLKGKKTAPVRRRKLKLRLNRFGLDLLKNSASGRLNVNVTVQVRNGRQGVRTVRKVLQFRK